MGLMRNRVVLHAAVLILAAAIFNETSAAWAQLNPADFTSLGTLSVSSGTLNINTDTLAVTGAATFTGVALNQNGGPQVAVFDFSSINIGGSVTVNISGSRAFALLSQGNTTINPTLTFVSASGGLGGFQGGGVREGTSGDQENEAGFGPGGGYAFGTSGGGGGYGGLGGVTGGAAGGLTYGDLFQTLQGGGGGGASTGVSTPNATATGGPGGGAIEIVSTGTLTLASVNVLGVAGTSSASNASGGGGAGGGILLSGGTGLSVSGTLNAGGGNGSGVSAGGGGGGRIALVGSSSYTLGGSTVTLNLNGGNGAGAGSFAGSAGVLTLEPVSTIIPNGKAITLDGTTIVVTAGSVTQTTPTVELHLRNDLVVNAGATVTWGIDDALGHLNSSGNNVTSITNNGTVSMGGFSQTVDTLSGTTSAATLTIPTASTLTVGANNGTGSYIGQILGAGTLVKTGSGTLTLGSANTFSGSTMLTGGTLTASNNLALQNSTVTLAGGSLSFSGATPTIGALAGTSNLSLGGLSTLSVGGNNSSTVYSGNLSGSISTGLNKAGTGTWTLAGTNTETGPLNVQNGTVLVGSTGALSPTAPITISSGATLDLNDYNYAVTASNALIVNGALRNGSISGTGAITLNGSGSLTGISTATSATINQNGAATVSNFTNNGQFNNAASQVLTWSNGTVTAAGRLTVNGTVNASDFISDGVITISSTGTISNSGSNFYLGGGSRTTVNASGHLTMVGSTTIELNGGLLVNNGIITGTTNVNYGSLAKGTGTYGVVNVGQGGVYAPGNSPGIVTASAVTFDSTPVSSGAATLQIELAGTTPGTEYDQLHVTGQLSLGGLLQVVLLPGFTPALNNRFDIMDWGTLSGKFGSMSLPTLSAGLSWSTLQLYSTGELQVASTGLLPGDFSRDQHITAADIFGMEQALSDLQDYEQSHGGLMDPQVLALGDLDGDGKFTNADLQRLLVDLKTGGGSETSVPEPAALQLAAVGGLLLAAAQWRCKRPMTAAAKFA